MQTKQNDSEGNIQFDAIQYSGSDIGTEFTYQVREQAGSDENMIYDSSVYTISVKPYQDPNNAAAIIATPVITKDGAEVTEIAFNNVTRTAETVETPERPEHLEDKGATQTGDSSKPVLWFALSVVSAAVLIIMGLRRKNQK